MSGLASSYPNNLPGKQTIQYIQRRLNQEALPADGLQRLYDKVAERSVYFPVWAVIDQTIGELSLRKGKGGILRHWISFRDSRGRDYAMRCFDPGRWPILPVWAVGASLVVDTPLSDAYVDGRDVPGAADSFAESARLPYADSGMELVIDILPFIDIKPEPETLESLAMPAIF